MHLTPVLLLLVILLAACGRVAPLAIATPRTPAPSTLPTTADVVRLVRAELEVDVACSTVRVADVAVTHRFPPATYGFACRYVESCPAGGTDRVLVARGTADLATRRVELLALEEDPKLPIRTTHPAAVTPPSRLQRVRSARVGNGSSPGM